MDLLEIWLKMKQKWMRSNKVLHDDGNLSTRVEHSDSLFGRSGPALVKGVRGRLSSRLSREDFLEISSADTSICTDADDLSVRGDINSASSGACSAALGAPFNGRKSTPRSHEPNEPAFATSSSHAWCGSEKSEPLASGQAVSRSGTGAQQLPPSHIQRSASSPPETSAATDSPDGGCARTVCGAGVDPRRQDDAAGRRRRVAPEQFSSRAAPPSCRRSSDGRHFADTREQAVSTTGRDCPSSGNSPPIHQHTAGYTASEPATACRRNLKAAAAAAAAQDDMCGPRHAAPLRRGEEACVEHCAVVGGSVLGDHDKMRRPPSGRDLDDDAEGWAVLQELDRFGAENALFIRNPSFPAGLAAVGGGSGGGGGVEAMPGRVRPRFGGLSAAGPAAARERARAEVAARDPVAAHVLGPGVRAQRVVQRFQSSQPRGLGPVSATAAAAAVYAHRGSTLPAGAGMAAAAAARGCGKGAKPPRSHSVLSGGQGRAAEAGGDATAALEPASPPRARSCPLAVEADSAGSAAGRA